MVKIYHNKRIKNDLIKNKQIKNTNSKLKLKSSKFKNISFSKKFKKIFRHKKLSCHSINNNENQPCNNIFNYPNYYNNDILKNDKYYVMRCYDCSFIPLIKIKYSQINLIQNKDIFLENNDKYAMVQLFCCKGHDITTTLKQYLMSCKINHNFLSLCGECHESKSNEFFNFSFCKICKKTLCIKCSENHEHNNKKINISDIPQNEENIINIDNQKSKNLISINEIDFHCKKHKKEFIQFCKDCNSNLCDECKNEHNISHKKIELRDIKLSEDEINSIEYNIDLAKKRIILFNIKILKFIQSLLNLEKIHQQLLNLYNFFISIYIDQLSFAEILLSIYKDALSINKFNFQVIQNVRNLKFNIRGIPIKNSYDFSTNIKALTSYLTNNKNFLLLDIKNYYSNKKIVKTRIRAAAKRIRTKIHLSIKINKNDDYKKENNSNNIDDNNQKIEENNTFNDKDLKNNIIEENKINVEK